MARVLQLDVISNLDLSHELITYPSRTSTFPFYRVERNHLPLHKSWLSPQISRFWATWWQWERRRAAQLGPKGSFALGLRWVLQGGRWAQNPPPQSFFLRPFPQSGENQCLLLDCGQLRDGKHGLEASASAWDNCQKLSFLTVFFLWSCCLNLIHSVPLQWGNLCPFIDIAEVIHISVDTFQLSLLSDGPFW